MAMYEGPQRRYKFAAVRGRRLYFGERLSLNLELIVKSSGSTEQVCFDLSMDEIDRFINVLRRGREAIEPCVMLESLE